MDYPNPYRSTVTYDDGSGGPVLKVSRIPPQNIVRKLLTREIWTGRQCGKEKYLQRSMYQSIFPNFTVTQVDKPPCFLRKFTPDGKYFIAFSSDQMSIEIYTFKGPQAATHLFSTDISSGLINKEDEGFINTSGIKLPCRDHISTEEKDCHSQYVRKNCFDAFFRLKCRINVASEGAQLNRECSLFTENSQYMIAGSATTVHDEISHPQFHEFYRNNESLQSTGRPNLEDYTIHLVDIKRGVQLDTRTFKVDKIYLSHNQGIYLYNNILAVLSVQHQTIHIFHIMDEQLVEIRTIGRFCYEDDELITGSGTLYTTPAGPVKPFEEAFTNSLKHRLLVFLYKRASRLFEKEGDRSGLTMFHQYYEQFRNMKIWKMQLIDEENLLLKYSSEEVATLRVPEPNTCHSVLVVYNIPSTEILSVFENTSKEYLDMFENFSDSFRNNLISSDARYSSSPSNNIYARQIHQRFRQTITSARFGGPIEATKRILAQLPISAQSYSPSPYLDQGLFSYDDHRVSCMERPKACGDVPIRFFGRDTSLYKFQIHAGMLPKGQTPQSTGRRLVAFTFHPNAPFAISVQRANAEYLVNFHFRVDECLLGECSLSS